MLLARFLRLLSWLIALLTLGGVAAVLLLFVAPRPPDTTDPAIWAADGADVDYCQVPQLDGSGLRAADIPKAFTPGCGYRRWPMPVLAECTEPLAPGATDMRGLWQGTAPDGTDHLERIEQCGNRVVVTSEGVIHDFVADGTLENGARDVSPPGCINIWASIEWERGAMVFQPGGLGWKGVTRELQGDRLVWTYPSLGEVPMQRVCKVPQRHNPMLAPAG